MENNEIIESLWTRELCKGNALYSISKEEATEHHLSMVSNPIRERELLRQGNLLVVKSYRIHETPRQLRGLVHTIPADSIAHRIVTAGYLATREMTRLQYVTKQ